MSKGICTHCHEFKEISNDDLVLCTECSELGQFKPKEKKAYRIPKQSAKQKKREAEKREAYRSKGEVKYCESCGSTEYPLSASHTIPVSQRPDLEKDPENIIFECYGGSDRCHDIWEHGTLKQRKKLLTFQRKINYIVKVGDVKALERYAGTK